MYGACTGDRVGLGAGRLFYSTFDVTYVFPTLRSHKSARAAVQVTTYGRKPRPAVGYYSSRAAALSTTCLQVGTTLSLTTSVVRLSSRARLDTRPRPLSLKPLCVHTSCHVSALPSSPFSRLPPNLTVWLRSKQLRRPVSASAS